MGEGRSSFRIGVSKPDSKTGRIPLPMKLTVAELLKQFTRVLQGVLFPTLQEELGPLTEKHRQLVALLSLIRIEAMIACWAGGVGRPAKDRRAIARSFVAKAVYNEHHAAVAGAPVGRHFMASHLRLGESPRDSA